VTFFETQCILAYMCVCARAVSVTMWIAAVKFLMMTTATALPVSDRNG